MVLDSDPHGACVLKARAWNEFQTVLVYIGVSHAAWWPPNEDTPGILIAPGPEQAASLIDKMVSAFPSDLNPLESST